MTELPQDVKRLLAEAKQPLGIKELLQLAGLHPGQHTQLKRTLRELVRRGEVRKEGKRFLLQAQRPAFPGGDGGARPPGVRRRREAHGPGGSRAPEWDQRSAPRGRAQPGDRPAPRGRFVREGRVEQPGARGRVEQRGPERGPAPGGRGPPRRPAWGEAPEPMVVEGILHVHRDGYGFVHPSSGQGDNIFLPPQEAARALDNDRVLVRAWGRPGRMEGKLLRVVDRIRQLAVGTYVEHSRRHAMVVPYDKNLQAQGPIRVPATQMARDGDVVKVRLGVGAELLEPGEGLYGEVSGSVGKPGDPSAEVLSIAFSGGFSDEFPPEVMDEADAIGVTVTEEEVRTEGRRDLRALELITIDGEDARDFDDAVYTEPHPQGWRLVVAIADVTHYVREGTALNAEALRRATSVYLPDRVLPMLPERLSNGICSLRPEEDRLCMVADMVLDTRGKLVSSELYPGVMRSHARCTYNEVQDVLDGKDVPHRNAFKPQFERLMTLARVLMRMRKERGAIDFNLPEHKVVMGPDGHPAHMELRERKDSHRLIEECMLAANEAVARFFSEEGLPSVYRFHGEPDEEKLATFTQLAQAYGFRLLPEDVTSKEINAFMAQLQGHPEERALNQILLRSMMQAVYTASSVGHYGLAAEYYLHFTSPIRRYPDLLVHRLLKFHWARQGGERSERQLEREERELEAMAAQSSERERAAMQVEREVVSYYAALMMKDRLGEEFAATVSGVADIGAFVELDEVHVEGLVRAESLGPGARFDKTVHALVYPGGMRVRVGQKLRVRLVNVNVALRRIEFDAIEFEGRAVQALGAEARQAEREAREERKREAREEGRRAARLAREREREERWGRPPAARVEAPVAAPPRPEVSREAPVTVERPPEVAAEAGTPPTAQPAGFERLRALAARTKEPIVTPPPGAPEPIAVPLQPRRKVAAAPEKEKAQAPAKKPSRAKAQKKAPARKKAAAAAKKAPVAKKVPASKQASVAKKAPARKKAAAVAKKAPAAKKAAAKKAAAKKAPVAKKAAAVKKAPARKQAATAKTARKAPAKKTAASRKARGR